MNGEDTAVSAQPGEGSSADNGANKPVEPVRSILKKASSDQTMVPRDIQSAVGRRSLSSSKRAKKGTRMITFSDSVTTYYAEGVSDTEAAVEEKLDDGDDDVWKEVECDDTDDTSSPSASPLPNGTEAEDKSTSSKITSTVKSKVGNIWKKSSRTQVQSVTPKFETGQTSISVKKRRQKEYLTSSCGVVEGLQPGTLPGSSSATGTERGKLRSQSLPRGVSFDSAELFDKGNHNWKSRLLHFRRKRSVANDSSEGAVLTKVTSLASAGGDAQDGSDSGSDDEKGGTIKKMPKLRHVSVKRPDMAEDDTEPQYHQLFEYVFVVRLKEDSKKKIVAETTYTFPPTCNFKGKDSALQAIPQFCYPDIDQWKPTKTYASESFSFVLTDIEGNRRFGYCRRLLPDGDGPRLPEVYCIISPLGCFSLYENILDHVEERRKFNSLSVFNFLKAISANPFPRPGRSVTVKVFGAGGSGMEPVTFTRPVDSRLEHVDFSILFSTLSQRKIIKLFSSLLMERRVIFCASSLSLTTGCAHALMALLYPFEWQHVFIPVLPSSLIDFVCSPLPYIIGINPSSCHRLDQMEMEEAVVINLDKSKFIKLIGDEGSILPSKLFQFLEGKLGASVITSEYSKKASAKKGSNTSKADELVVNTFMTFFAYLYGDYRENMKMLESGQSEFQKAEYIKRFKSKSTRRFLDAFQMTQMFESFIEVRELPSKAEILAASMFEKKLPDLKTRCQDIEIFSSKSRFDRWKMKKDLAKGD